MSEDEFVALRGHRFPGGRYRIEHWENWLLTHCTGRAPLPDGLVHPIALFHVPILGAGTSIGEIFRLGGASGDSGSVGLLGYDWEYLRPLREEVDYRVTGGIVETERRASPSGAIDDRLTFRIEMRDGDDLVARVTNRWRFRRSRPATSNGPAGRRAPTATDGGGSNGVDRDVERAGDHGGTAIPAWEMVAVDPARMRTMAALLRDPYPVHWDRDANERLGLGGRVVNQGPLNLSYVANMLMDWAGPASIRRLTVSFGAPVLDGDHVVARGRVRDERDRLAHCDVWLARGDERVVTGTAEVDLSRAVTPPSEAAGHLDDLA